jgi:hypothetical protein
MRKTSVPTRSNGVRLAGPRIDGRPHRRHSVTALDKDVARASGVSRVRVVFHTMVCRQPHATPHGITVLSPATEQAAGLHLLLAATTSVEKRGNSAIGVGTENICSANPARRPVPSCPAALAPNTKMMPLSVVMHV